MHKVKIGVTVPLPNLLYKLLRRLKHIFKSPSHYERVDVCNMNLLGDRDIEWAWIASQMPSGPGEALDFGSGGSNLGLIAVQRGFNVIAVDLQPVHWYYVHPALRFIQCDILKLPLPEEHFDLIINCSTVEHVGLAGRYGVTENRPDGDLEAMARLKKLMKSDGIMLLTIPVGCDAVFPPLTRIYGKKRLPLLLEGFIVEKEIFWIKDDKNRWKLTDKETATHFKASAGSQNPFQNIYALGCFVLKKS
jgi:SAM-dependent methyltransferase